MRIILQSVLGLAFMSGLASAQTITQTFGTGANAFTMDFVTIGNPNNAADTTGDPNPVGSVAYTYNLGKYEVSRDMITKANLAGSLGITMYDMTSYGGNGVNRPATGVTWNEAARFVNYLNTSKGYQAAYNFTTSGVNDNITLWGVGQYNGNNPFRHKNAYYFLPSVDEWYKGAYGSPSGTWYNFATGTDSEPTAVVSGTAANTAVYNKSSLASDSPADITSAGGLSPYGTMGQGGNVWEFNETAIDGVNNRWDEPRGLRGGAWSSGRSTPNSSDSFYLEASYSHSAESWYGDKGYGFRVAMIPEPSSLSLLALGGVVVALGRLRR